ncbi:bifunctional folylpolyglutamate synthase/dihydrofolate synthase [Lapidilactobacillus luobeiensis]|uniref:bifunctional folylpolyglutamate synthase/dihydrofolate synthase n=1 Tax=Lapidilactobacillus luobeiensis TaxID=2950371 RepID=UPI0021C3BD4F|nr:folylpolyglutamate synthase/dihydrofolate synthase family protein [Lapidilactobacillus luobeiensis]
MVTIAEVLAFLHSRPRLHRSDKLDLMRQALRLFDDPQDKFATIHVTGTNGKGTTCHLISSLLVAQGYHVGLFTSPFVLRFNERIQIDDQQIPDAELIKLVTRLRPILQQAHLELTEFEWVTLLMFCYFADQKVDVGVIEVGIGGAHDRTNVINASVGVITSIGLDHEDLIGPTLQDIAEEKAGIIKAKQTVFLGKLPAETQTIMARRVAQEQALSYQEGQDLITEKVRWSQQGVRFDWSWSGATPVHLRQLQLPAWSQWQLQACSLALGATAAWLAQHHDHLDSKRVRQVLADFHVPGRLELLSQEPLIVLDGAHNIAAIQALIKTIQRTFPGQPVYLTIAMMADKDIHEVAALLAKTSWQITWTTLAHNPRAADQARLATQLPGDFNYAPDWQTAFQNALHDSGGTGVFLFAGSFYLISEVRQFFLPEASRSQNGHD